VEVKKMIMHLRILTVNDDFDLSKCFETLMLEKDEAFGWETEYKFVSQIKGGWYTISPVISEGENFYEKINDICEGKLECDNALLCPFWANKHSIEYSLYPLIVNERYFNDFCRILYHCVKNSKNNIIIFLPKFAEVKDDLLAGTISIRNFIKLLSTQKILCGMCYVITI